MGELLIERIPLEDHERILPPKKFQRMPTLYLELLENKTKVRRDLLNEFYIPPPLEKMKETPNDVHETLEQIKKDSTSDPEIQLEEPINHLAEREHLGEHEHLEEHLGEHEHHGEREHRGEHLEEHEHLGEREHLREHHGKREQSNSLEDRLNSLLGEDKEDDPISMSQSQPPTLKELIENKKVKINKSYNYVDDEKTQKDRNAIYFRYEVLRRMHPNANIPEFTLYSDPKLMSQKYEMLTKKLSLDSSVENWKRYMIVFVMGCEVVLGKINFDMEGFAQQQIMSMNTYDQLLVEMAEKSYMPTGSKWSPEIRLCMMLTMNVVLFIVSKMIFKKTGTNLLGSINTMTNATERNMKEPSTNV